MFRNLRFLQVYVLLVGVSLAQDSGTKSKEYVIDIKNLQGQSVGKGILSPATPKGVKLDLDITGLPPGSHAFHIHQKPLCEASEEFDTAGLQYDPTGEMYGNGEHKDHGGHSAGDPRSTIHVAEDGTGHLSVVFPALTMGSDDHSVFFNGGTTIMFHAAAGAKGSTRIACGVIQRK